jgi:tetratricopeptide (TPR) repeat protein
MATNMPNNMPNGGVSSGNSEMKEFFIQHGMVVGAILLVVVIVVIAIVHFHGSRTQANAAQAELLGPALAYEYTGKKDSALAEYDRLLNENALSGETLAKAALLAGNIRFQNGEFDAAAILYQKALDNAGSLPLVRGGAMHGQASVAIEKKDYAAAVNLLEKFVSEFGKRTGDLEDRYEKVEPADPVPTVADALWKLSLVYVQMGYPDKAKATAEKLLKVYGDSPVYVERAQKLIATL